MQSMHKCRTINLSFDIIPEFHCVYKKRWRCEQQLGNCKIQVCCTRRFDESALTGMFHSEYLEN